MKFLKYFLFLILILVIGLAIYIAVQPNDYELSRSRVIKAPAAVLYNKVNDFKSWQGDILAESNMKTTATEPYKSIAQDINFIKPFEASSKINWTFKDTPEGTKVTWAMRGKQDFMTKAFTAFMGPIEKTTGPDFERGLFKLDSIAQQDMKKYSIKVEGVTEHGGGFYLYNTSSCKMTDLPEKMAKMMPKLNEYIKKNNITMAGPPYVLYHKMDSENGTVMFSCCIPTIAKIISADSDILTGELKAFNALLTTLRGNYINLREAWTKTFDHLSKNSLEQIENGVMLESYVTDPNLTPNPANYLTDLFVEIKK